MNPDPGSQDNNQGTPGIPTGQPPLSHATASIGAVTAHNDEK
jgi:hypothetical protein